MKCFIFFTLLIFSCNLFSQEKINLDPQGVWYHEYAVIEGEMLTNEQVLDFEKRYNQEVKGNRYVSMDKNGIFNNASLDVVRWYRDSRDGEYAILAKTYPKNTNDKNSEKEWRTFLRFRMINNNLMELVCIRNGNDNSLYSIKNGDVEFPLFKDAIDGVKYIFYFRKK